jgi:hypothetical protein
MAVHYFDQAGSWIAFRRDEEDRFIFNTSGEWIGWFPWGDEDAVDTDGQYLGSVIRNRFLQRDYFPFRGFPGFAGFFSHASGFSDVPAAQLKNR